MCRVIATCSLPRGAGVYMGYRAGCCVLLTCCVQFGYVFGQCKRLYLNINACSSMKPKGRLRNVRRPNPVSGWPHELVEEFRYPSLLFMQGVVKGKWIQRLDILCQKLLEEW